MIRAFNVLVIVLAIVIFAQAGASQTWIQAGPDPARMRSTGPWKPKERATLIIEVLEIYRGVPDAREQARLDQLREEIGRETDADKRARLESRLQSMLELLVRNGDWVVVGIPGQEPSVHDELIALRIPGSRKRPLRELAIGDFVSTVEPKRENEYTRSWEAQYLVNEIDRPLWWREQPILIQTGTTHPVFDASWQRKFRFHKAASKDSRETTAIASTASDAVILIRTIDSEGTGFIINSDGVAVTNKHVVENYATFDAVLASGKVVQGTVIGVAADADLALVQLPGTNHNFLQLDLDEPTLGEDLLVVGNAAGMGISVTRGIVSGVRTIRGIRAIQTDAAINNGNSGGPVMRATGAVLGVATWKLFEQEGMGYAILASEVVDCLPLTTTGN